jgi:omega-6 fatty acid desaturase (delta-12 desaturase)
LLASSRLELPGVLRFFTMDIGKRYVHHLDPRIPNYNLARANDANEFLRAAKTLSLGDGLRAMRLTLCDPQSSRLVSFAEARRARIEHASLA